MVLDEGQSVTAVAARTDLTVSALGLWVSTRIARTVERV
jgi:hypothetical protein